MLSRIVHSLIIQSSFRPLPLTHVMTTETHPETNIPGGNRTLLLCFGPVLEQKQNGHLHLHFLIIAQQHLPIQVIPQHLRAQEKGFVKAARRCRQVEAAPGYRDPHPASQIAQADNSKTKACWAQDEHAELHTACLEQYSP